MNKYFNHGLVGNSRMLAATDKKGTIQRIFYPNPDSRQLIDTYKIGIKVSGMINTFSINEDFEFVKQEYVSNTNILKTELEKKDIELKIILIDFIDKNKDVLYRKIEVMNQASHNIDINILSYTKMQSNKEQIPSVKAEFNKGIGIHYIKDHYMSVGFIDGIEDYIIGMDLEHNFQTANLEGFDKIGMMSGLLLKSKRKIIKPNNKAEYIQFFGFTQTFNEVDNLYRYISNNSYETLYDKCYEYWLNFVKDKNIIETDNKILNKIWIRSILFFKLMQDERTGGILASCEVDEYFTKSGRYAYCWGRDAVFITKAFALANLKEEAYNFYRWAKMTQQEDGSWEQRYYLDGNLAPAWGFQVDETGSIIHGIYECYNIFKETDFIKEMQEVIFMANEFLADNIDQDTKLPNISFDLWEERRGIHLYSSAAVYNSLIKGHKLLKIINRETKETKRWLDIAKSIKENIDKYFWKEEYKRYIRSIRVKKNPFGREDSNDVIWLETDNRGYKRDYTKEDWKFDISILGASLPFEMLNYNEEKMVKTFQYIEQTLRDEKTGCLLRYEDDIYAGGNPWIISTLWAGLYASKIGDKKKAYEYLINSAKTVNHNNLLPEQVDRESGKVKWIVSLTWSHAMFVDLMYELKEYINDNGRIE